VLDAHPDRANLELRLTQAGVSYLTEDFRYRGVKLARPSSEPMSGDDPERTSVRLKAFARLMVFSQTSRDRYLICRVHSQLIAESQESRIAGGISR
jgi:hypothetical protein